MVYYLINGFLNNWFHILFLNLHIYTNSESESPSVVSDSLQPHSQNSPGQNTGVGSLSLLQVILPTQGSNPGLLHCRRILYQLSHKGSPICVCAYMCVCVFVCICVCVCVFVYIFSNKYIAVVSTLLLIVNF